MAVSIATQNLLSGTGDFLADGSIPMTGSLNMDTHQISNVVDPTLDQDAATKKYVDDQISAMFNKAVALGTL